MQVTGTIKKKRRVAYIADNLPPIIKTSSNRNFAFMMELIKEYDLHVFTFASSDSIQQTVSPVSRESLTIHTISQSQSGWRSFSIVKYLLRFSHLDIINSNIIHAINDEIKKQSFDLILISAGPFNRLKVGYEMYRQFNIPWCIDYRDEWNSAGSLRSKVVPTLVTRILDLLLPSEKSLELKFTSTIAAFSSVHLTSVENINHFTGKKGFVIENGYFKSSFLQNDYKIPTNEPIRFAYWGSVYDSQNMKEHLIALASFAQLHHIHMMVDFFGCQEKEFRSFQTKEIVGNHYLRLRQISPLPIEKLFAEVISYDALIHSEYEDNPHIPSSKLYDYIATGLPVVLFNNFGGYISSVLSQTHQLLNFESPEFLQFLTSCNFREQFRMHVNDKVRIKYSREQQMTNVHQMIQFALNAEHHS
ncbi:MAG: hypothetical protein HYZ44_00240 [Bacteroidetes bacterium]|nr:hypothetical protein [Bacteroidota bacterium]